MSKNQSLQDPFLNALRKEHIPVYIFLVNGIKLQGHIESFDPYVLLLKNSVGQIQIIYKHSISTVFPSRNPRPNIGVFMSQFGGRYGFGHTGEMNSEAQFESIPHEMGENGEHL